MPVDPARAETVREWLAIAATDLRAGAKLVIGPEPEAAPASFHAQQAAEKAMKAFLVWNDLAFRKTHDLGDLGRLCSQADPSLQGICKAAESITKFASVFRYPPTREVTPLEAIGALRIAREVYDAMLAVLPIEVRPEKSP